MLEVITAGKQGIDQIGYPLCLATTDNGVGDVAVARVIEISATTPQSFADVIRQGSAVVRGERSARRSASVSSSASATTTALRPSFRASTGHIRRLASILAASGETPRRSPSSR